VTVNGYLEPGQSVGMLTIEGDVVLNAGSSLVIEVDGATADKLVVDGTVSLAGTLEIDQINPPPVGTIVIIDNDESDLVSGEFSNATEGGLISASGVDYQVSYVGGDGNDVTLTPLVCTPCAEFLEAAQLAVCDVMGSSFPEWSAAVEAMIAATVFPPVCDDGNPGGGSEAACEAYIRGQILNDAVCIAVKGILGL
jgi:hypothetical protein